MRAFTQPFNAMSAPVGREPGMVGAALDVADAFVGIIADGHHVHEANLRIARAAKRRDRFTLITDAMPPAAGGPDHFDLQGRRLTNANGCLRLDDGTLGSVLAMDEGVRYVVNVVGLDLGDALGHQDLCVREQLLFLRAIRGEFDLTEHHEAAINSLSMVFAADESVRTGEVVRL